MAKKFYLTSAIPYVNSFPHVGHALEFIQTDAIARYHKLLGEDVLTLSGGDENALKNVQAAEKAGAPAQEFVDKNNKLFEELTIKLNARYDVWQKGSDQIHHFPSSQKLWEQCAQNDDIYQKSYEGLYCIGCETFYDPEELNEHGECVEHPGKPLEKVKEKNWFFRLSNYEKPIKDMIQNGQLDIVPQKRKNEVLAFLDRGLQDISISRSNERAKNWGVTVPGDPTQRIYVWFDALNIYQSGIGFGWDETTYEKWWPADLHVIGKGITRFHAVYWPAFLLSAGLSLPKKIFVHEYFTVNGQKMSKTLGNVIDPMMLIEKYGVDPLRYYFLAKFSPFNDGDFSEAEFKKTYNADLANGLGNLVARVAKLASTLNFQLSTFDFTDLNAGSYKIALTEYRFNDALSSVWEKIKAADKYIDENEPWKLTGEALHKILEHAIHQILEIATLLQPFLPQTSEKILSQFSTQPIRPQPSLFPRLT
ncbi:methionine--tRNA ligase [Candidatus Gottesmanbacteria bacterium]|nr:methionine--tRNA ligase [Candidatus Gottesmanbacteria bacterium]